MVPKFDSRQLAWAYLSRVCEGPNPYVHALLAQGEDIEKIVHGIKARESWLGPLLSATESRAHIDTAAEDLQRIHDLGGRMITADDNEWPTERFERAFGGVDADFIGSYLEQAFAPHVLWVRGQPLAATVDSAIGVVGTRAISAYGKRATTRICTDLVAADFTIVSGGAYGVDAAAHEAALAAGGPTVAVLARGVDQAYPAGHAGLFSRIVQQGCVLSEYPPGATPHRHRFLVRNRLVAALSDGVLVTEAPFRSGALNTLNWALSFGLPTMAVPGPVDNPNSIGCHERIRQQQAHLVYQAAHVLELVSPLGTVDPEAQLELEFPADALQRLSRKELRVFDATAREPQLTQDISESAGLGVGLCVRLLLHLEKQGLVRRVGECWQRA